MSKYWIIGPPGSGKSTLAKLIAEKKGITWYELDSFFWKKNWEKRNPIEFKEKLQEIIDKDVYILDGYYEALLDIIEEKCTVIILRKPLWLLLIRVIKRSVYRVLKNEKVCGENYESMSFLFSNDGLFKYTISQFFFFNKEQSWNKFSKTIYIRNNKEQARFLKKI